MSTPKSSSKNDGNILRYGIVMPNQLTHNFVRGRGDNPIDTHAHLTKCLGINRHMVVQKAISFHRCQIVKF